MDETYVFTVAVSGEDVQNAVEELRDLLINRGSIFIDPEGQDYQELFVHVTEKAKVSK